MGRITPPMQPKVLQFSTPEHRQKDLNVLRIWREAYITMLKTGKTREECVKIANDAVNDYQQEFK